MEGTCFPLQHCILTLSIHVGHSIWDKVCACVTCPPSTIWVLGAHCGGQQCYEAAALCHLNLGTQVGNLGAKVVWTSASAHVLHLPSIISPGILNMLGKSLVDLEP